MCEACSRVKLTSCFINSNESRYSASAQRLIGFQSEFTYQYIAVGERWISILLITITGIVQIMEKRKQNITFDEHIYCFINMITDPLTEVSMAKVL